MDHFYNILFEKAMNTVPDDVQKQLSRKSVRKTMPSDAFLLPSERKFPIKKPGSKDYDPALVYAAYVRAKQWSKKKPEYEKVASQAKELFIRIKGPSKLNIKLEGSIYETDSELKEITAILNNIKVLEKTPEDTSDDPDICLCTNCDYQCGLGIDDETCDTKTCPKCKSKMMDSVFTKDGNVTESLKKFSSMKGKMRFLMENTDLKKKKSSRKICNECSIIVTEYASTYQEDICPGCGNGFKDLSENITKIEQQKHFNCPKCQTVKPYTRINEDECPVCDSLMTVFAVPSVKKDKGIPINTD